MQALWPSQLPSSLQRRPVVQSSHHARLCEHVRRRSLSPHFTALALPVEEQQQQQQQEEGQQHVAPKRAVKPLSPAEMEEWIISTRRLLHGIPELSFQEYKTSAIIRSTLDGLGISYDYPVARTGIVARLGNGRGPTVALRADMDALPIKELTGLPYCSQHDGCMHACGHDCHCAMLLGAARILKQAEEQLGELQGTVKLIFQPAEEADGGGQVMVDQGVLKDAEVAFALHVWPVLPAGTIATRPGPLMAGVLSFEATITGQGGHAAMPHLTTNPVIAASSIVASLRQLVTDLLPPYEPAVVNVCHISSSGGSAFNVVPDEVKFGGTVRAFSDQTMQALCKRLEQVVGSQAELFNCKGSVSFREEKEPYFPPLINNPEAVDFARSVAKRVFGEGNVKEADLTMASEDFAFMAQAVPSCFAFLGVRNEEIGAIHSLHSPLFKVDESALKLGANYLASVALDYLEEAARQTVGGSMEFLDPPSRPNGNGNGHHTASYEMRR